MKTADLNEWICVQTVYNGGMSVQTGNESEKRVHLTRWGKWWADKVSKEEERGRKNQVSAIMKLTWNSRKGNLKIF